MSPMFVLGPVDVADEVLAAQTRPMLPHRSQEFEVIFKRAEEESRNLFQTDLGLSSRLPLAAGFRKQP